MVYVLKNAGLWFKIVLSLVLEEAGAVNGAWSHVLRNVQHNVCVFVGTLVGSWFSRVVFP